ncbi:hypothetical protein ACWCZ5_17795 [Streptomyces sp. NPDC001667]
MRLRNALTTAAAVAATTCAFITMPTAAHATTQVGEWCRDSVYTDANKAQLQPCIGIDQGENLYVSGHILQGPTYCDHHECGLKPAKIWLQLNRVVNGQVQGGGPIWINDVWLDGSQSFTVKFGGVNPDPPRGTWYNVSMGYIFGPDGKWYDNVQSKVIYYG